jgi:hypothetical protein
MKYAYSLIIALALIISGASLAYAKDSFDSGLINFDSSGSGKDGSQDGGDLRIETRIKDELGERREETRVHNGEVRTEIRERNDLFKAEARERADSLGAKIESKFEARLGDSERGRSSIIGEIRDRIGLGRDEAEVENEDDANEGAEKSEEAQERRVEFQQDIAERHAENVSRVISATIGRLEKIIERIGSRISKLQENGIDTTEAEGYIKSAKEDLINARASVSAFASIDLSSADAQTNFEKVRAAAKEAAGHIKSAHGNLRLAVSSLKAERDSSEATSTEDKLDDQNETNNL